MALESKAISMKPVKEKLRNLKEYLPGEDDFMYGFGKYLAERLNPELIPEGFNLACELTIDELRKGGDYGKYGKVKVPPSLVGYPSVLYDVLRMRIPDFAKAACPPEFAEEVNKVYEEVNAKIKEDRE